MSRTQGSQRWSRMVMGAGLLASMVALGCGGGDKKVAEPVPVSDESVEPEPDNGADQIEPEILDSIQRTFARKQTVVARCFVVAVESGELEKTAKGFVTVGATVTPSGTATGAEVLKTSLKSKALHACITEMVETWSFEEPPRAVETSFTYTLERL